MEFTLIYGGNEVAIYQLEKDGHCITKYIYSDHIHYVVTYKGEEVLEWEERL